jgi:hypothetical protein
MFYFNVNRRKLSDIDEELSVIGQRNGKDEVDESPGDEVKEDGPRELNLSLFQSELYRHLLVLKDPLTVEQFVAKLKMPLDLFRVEEYWEGWKHSAKFMVVDKGMLDWLGYEGKLKDQRRHALDVLRSNFRVDMDFIYEGAVNSALLIGGDRQPKKAKILAVSYPCLLQWSMMIQTARGAQIRKQCAAQQMLFRLYMEYQAEFQAQEQKLLLEAKEEALEGQIHQLQKQLDSIKLRRVPHLKG